MTTATLAAPGLKLRKFGLPLHHDRVTAADPTAALKAAKRTFDRLKATLEEREGRRNSLLTDAHTDPMSDDEKTLRRERKERGETNPKVPGWGRRGAVARIIGQSERNVRNLQEAELAYREAKGLPRRLEDPDTALKLLPQAQKAVAEVADARNAYYEAIADALPPRVPGSRPTQADGERFSQVTHITALDTSHLRRIQRGVEERRAAENPTEA